MELKFIWVDKYRNIEKTGFNLSHTGNHRFAFEQNRLNLVPNNKSLLDFGNKVLSVTAIAGQNGVGKSSLCEVISHSIATMTNGSFGYDLEFEGIVCIDKYIFFHEELSISNQDQLREEGYELKNFSVSPLETMNFEIKREFFKLGFIYYSNVIDWRSNIRPVNMDNISTLKLLENHSVYGAHYTYRSANDRRYFNRFRYKDQIDSLTSFYIEESQKNVSFYLNFERMVPFQGPMYFQLDTSYSDNNKWLSAHDLDYEDRLSLDNIQKEIFDHFHSIPLPNIGDDSDGVMDTDQSLLKLCLGQLYRLNLVRSRVKLNGSLPDIGNLRRFVFDNEEWLFEDSENVERLLELFASLLELGNGLKDYNPYFEERIQNEYIGDWRFYVLRSFWIDNNERSRELLKEFLPLEVTVVSHYQNSLARISDCFMFPGISAGENSYYSLFSRLYYSIKANELGIDDRSHFILFIDEAEIGFHPSWKKKLLQWLLNFLNSEFHSYTFQIIITTHSPYLLSDLCNQNLLLLKRSEQGKTEVVDYKSRRTFGANIYELLSDSFFMEDGFIGDFAKEVLESIVAYLKSDDIESQIWDEARAKGMIGQVADDLIRMRLEDLFNEKFDNSTESLLSEKERLESRLNQIRTRLRDDQNTTD